MTRWRRTTPCERAPQWISLDLDGELGRLEQAALVRHLRRCDSCRSASAEIGGFTGLLRSAPPVEPARAIVVPGPAWARRRAAGTLRGGALVLAVAAAVFASLTALTASPSAPTGTFGFANEAQQINFAREHVASEPIVYLIEPPTAHSFADRVLL
jgi:ferric-dicitrate binding protein FerR (iron transport regulator)